MLLASTALISPLSNENSFTEPVRAVEQIKVYSALQPAMESHVTLSTEEWMASDIQTLVTTFHGENWEPTRAERIAAWRAIKANPPSLEDQLDRLAEAFANDIDEVFATPHLKSHPL